MNKQDMLVQIDAQLRRAQDTVLRIEGYRMALVDLIKAEETEAAQAKADAEAANQAPLQPENGDEKAAA